MNAEIISSRMMAHPRAEVYAAFSDAALLAEWWGPSGFTNRFQTFDLRPGGVWLFDMIAPDGSEYRMAKEFLEVVPLERIVVLHTEPVEHRFRLTMSFADENGGTRVTWRMAFESAEEDAKVRSIVQGANEQNLDRLRALLERGAHLRTADQPPVLEPARIRAG